MKDKVVIEYTRGNINEVKTLWDANEANTLLATGDWFLFHAGIAHKDASGFHAVPVFILARKPIETK